MNRIGSRSLVALLMLLPIAAQAGEAAPSGCDDLGVLPATPAVDFAADIQPILDNCTGCHGDSPQAGLDLRAGRSFENLVDVTASTNPARRRVVPFDPEASLLLSAVNCDVTGGPSFRMPGTTLEQRALIRDWIAQGALARPAAQAWPVPDLGGPGRILLVFVLAWLACIRLRP